MKSLKILYENIKPEIEKKLKEFSDIWNNASDEEIFAELVYCLLTPQSKANYCMIAVDNLVKKNFCWSEIPLKFSHNLIRSDLNLKNQNM